MRSRGWRVRCWPDWRRRATVRRCIAVCDQPRDGRGTFACWWRMAEDAGAASWLPAMRQADVAWRPGTALRRQPLCGACCRASAGYRGAGPLLTRYPKWSHLIPSAWRQSGSNAEFTRPLRVKPAADHPPDNPHYAMGGWTAYEPLPESKGYTAAQGRPPWAGAAPARTARCIID